MLRPWLIGLAGVLALATPAGAQTTTWTGTLNASWTNPGNWSGGAIPGPGDDVVLAPAPFQPMLFSQDPTCDDLTIQAGATLTLVNGWDLSVGGDLLVEAGGALSVTALGSVVTVTGDWTNDGAYAGGGAPVVLAGTGIVGGAVPSAFGDVTIAAGTRTASTPFTVAGALVVEAGATLELPSGTIEVAGDLDASAAGAAVTGAGTLRLVGDGDLRGGASTLPELEVAAGLRRAFTTTTSALALMGGELELRGGEVLAVADDALLSGGLLSFQVAGGNAKTLDVDGDVVVAGTTAGPAGATALVRCAGDWTADAAFAMPAGTVELDGGGPHAIGGPGPVFPDLALVASSATLFGDASVAGALTAEPDTTLALGSHTLSVTSDAVLDGATVTGTGPLILIGDGVLDTGATSVPSLVVASGARDVETSATSALSLAGGTLRILEDQTLSVSGDATLSGGELAFELGGFLLKTLDVEGDVVVTGTTASVPTPPSARVRCAGDWTSGPGFAPDDGTIVLDGAGTTTIAGPGPAFASLELQGGARSLLADVEVGGGLTLDATTTLQLGPRTLALSGSLTSAGGDVTGTGAIAMTGAGGILMVGATASNLVVAGGTREAFAVDASSLTLTGGTLTVRDNALVRVDRADLLGGTLAFEVGGAFDETLDVDGPLTVTGTLVGEAGASARVRCAGDWSAPPTFVMPDGEVELDGGGAATIGGAGPVFPRLTIVDGTRTLVADAAVDGLLQLMPAATLDVADHTLAIDGAYVSTSASTLASAGGAVAFVGTGTVDTGTGALPDVVVQAGALDVIGATVEGLSLTGGALSIRNGATLTVLGDASLTGGTFGWEPTGFLDKTLDVAGDLATGGTTLADNPAQSRLVVGGDLSGDAAFAMTEGLVTFGGDGTLGGPAPTLPDVVVASGTRELLVDATFAGSLTIGAGATLDLGATTLDVDNSLTAAAGASVPGSGWVVLSGDGTLSSGATSLPNLRIDGGIRAVLGSTVANDLELMAGDVTIKDDEALLVGGDARLLGGTLGFDDFGQTPKTLDVAGDVLVDGAAADATIGSATIRCGGDWTSDASFVMQAGTVEWFGAGASSVSGAPRLPDLLVSAGTHTLLADVVVEGDVDLTGGDLALGGRTLEVAGFWTATSGSASGAGQVDFTGDGNLSTGAGSISAVRLSGGTRATLSSTIGGWTQTGGELVVTNGALVHVTGDAVFEGGTVSFSTGGAGLKTLDVDGDVTFQGAVAGSCSGQTRVSCGGDWTSDATFALDDGLVELDGDGLLAGAAPGFDPVFPTLTVGAGTRTVSGDVLVTADATEVAAGATLDVGEARLSLAGPGFVDVMGTLAVGRGGELLLGSAVDLNVATDGTLRVVGLPGEAARVGPLDGNGWDGIVRGALAASHFAFEGMGPAGLVVTSDAAIAPSPEDLRAGRFAMPSPAAGSALLDVRRPVATTFADVDYVDAAGVGTFNVRTLGGAPITFENAGGGFAGDAFDDDGPDLVQWTSVPATEVAAFDAAGGAGEVDVTWTTTSEVSIDAFVLEVDVGATGTFTTVAEVAPTGPGGYAVTDASVVPGVVHTYRLLQRRLDGEIDVLASDDTTPTGGGGPLVIAVGPGGDVPDLQTAVDASAGAPSALLRVEPGAYAPFTVGPAAATTLHVVGEPDGAVTVDTSLAPITIADTGPAQTVELSDLVVGAAAGAGPAISVAAAGGVVVLDDLVVAGAPGLPGVLVAASPRVTVQRSTVTGSPGLRLAVGSVALASRGAIDEVELLDASSLRTCELVTEAVVQPGSTFVAFEGAMPDVEIEELLVAGGAAATTVSGDAGDVVLLMLALGYQWLDRGPKFEMTGLVATPAPLQVALGAIPAGGIPLAFTVPDDPSVLGVPLVLQPLVQRADGKLRWGNVATAFVVEES